MTAVTFQFSRPDFQGEEPWKRLISQAICKETRSEICHVDIVTLQGYLIGAHMSDGIQLRAPDYQKWGLRIQVTIPATEEQADKLYAYARTMLGTRYDVKAILGIALGDADLHDASKMICSGFAAVAVDEKAGLVRIAKDHWQVSPEELRIALTAQSGAVEKRIEG
jgi:hypothetical protein